MMRHALLRQPALLQLWKICILALMLVALAAPPCRAQDTDAPSATKAESVATTFSAWLPIVRAETFRL